MNETREVLIQIITEKAREMRRHAIDMAVLAGSNGAHLGPGYSMTEITATLYFGIMNYDPQNPTWPDRDRFILSKGHGVLGYYTALAEAGFFPMEVLDTFETDACDLSGHPCMKLDYGIEASTGSLGHGLPIAVGYALAARLDHRPYTVYCLVGDGECNEGSIWEAVMTANQYQLDNLVVVLDRNYLQSDGLSREIIQMDDMAEKWRAFGWLVREVDGHDVGQLLEALHIKSRPRGKPYVVIAHTTKGKGVSFFENNNDWHHNRLSKELAEKAYAELGFEYDGRFKVQERGG
ncbi:MAG TPA: transketolase [Anaerolineaceae bacterium]